MKSSRLITSLQHEIVKDTVKLRQNRDWRREHNLVVLEGVKTVEEVCKFHPAVRIFVVEPAIIAPGVEMDEMILVSIPVMQKLSGVQTPEGIIAVVPMPKTGNFKGKKRILVLDGINDPGNVGTLLRTALALGWDGAYILPGCADPYNDKALRASRGAPFRLPIIEGDWPQLEKMIQAEKWKPYAADLEGKKPSDVNLQEPIMLVVGSEAHGLSEVVQAECEPVSIPMPGEMESLNVAVAGGLLMYLWGPGGKS